MHSTEGEGKETPAGPFTAGPQWLPFVSKTEQKQNWELKLALDHHSH